MNILEEINRGGDQFLGFVIFQDEWLGPPDTQAENWPLLVTT